MYSFKKIFFCLALFCVLSIPQINAQLIDNRKAKIVLTDFFFNKEELKKRKIKTVSVSYSTKKSLKPIQTDSYKSTHFSIDRNGLLTRTYSTKKIFLSSIDTAVEWRYYKNEKLTTIKKTGVGGIDVKSVFYENNLPSTHIYGISQNSSSRKIDLFVSSYKELRAEYIDYQPLKEKDTLIKYKSLSSIVFKKELHEWPDSSTYKVTHIYPLAPEKKLVYTYSFKEKRCSSITIEKINKPIYKYTFKYSNSGKILSFNTFNVTQNTSTRFTELVYNEKNGLLRALITKDLYDNTIFIKKYTYTFHE